MNIKRGTHNSRPKPSPPSKESFIPQLPLSPPPLPSELNKSLHPIMQAALFPNSA